MPFRIGPYFCRVLLYNNVEYHFVTRELNMPYLTLAATGIEEVIVVSIGLIIVVGNVIAKRLRKDAANNAQGSQTPPTAWGGKSQRAARLEQLAAKRRAQLQQLAARRQSHGSDAPHTQQPSNLNMQQATQRHGAKTLYERRAEALRQMQQKQHKAAPPSRPLSQQHPQHQAAAKPQLKQKPRPTHADPQELSKVRERERHQLQQRQAAVRQHEADLRRHAQQLGSGATTVSHTQHGDISRVYRQVDDLVILPKVMPIHHIGGQDGMNISRETLRHAVLLKEILDPPIAMRQPQTSL